MASTKGSAVRTGLDEFPDPTAVPATLYDIFITIYDTINSMVNNIEQVTGLADVLPVDYAQYENEDVRVTNKYDALSKFYAPAGEDITYGKLVRIASDGKVYKNIGLDYNSDFTIRNYSPFIGFCGADVTAGDQCAVVVKGFLGASGVTPAQIYRSILPAGFEGNITTTRPDDQVPGSITTEHYHHCIVGEALSDEAIFIDGGF